MIELIMVMVVIGALAALGGVFIVEPFRASADMTRRAALVDQADLVLAHIRREVRTALPNSVRVKTDTANGLAAVEFVLTRAGGRYRRLPGSGGTGDPLNRAQAHGIFDALGGVPGLDKVRKGAAGIDCAQGDRDCISIYNTGQSGLNVYAQDNIAAIVDVVDNASGADQLEYDTNGVAPAFAAHSPRQRFFVIETVVSYVCDTAAGTLQRYADYGLHENQPLPNDGSGLLDPGDGALVADQVSACAFTYQSGSASRRGLLKMRLALTAGGETITLFAQTHVMNAP